MTRGIIASSLRFRLLVLVAAVGMLVVGVTTLPHAPVDTYPEFTPPAVDIQTEALGLSAAEIEQLITVPLEADLLNGVAWLQTIHSESIPGLSSIHLIFEPGTKLLKARQMVQERLNQPAAIPTVSKPPVMLPPTSSTSRTMMIGLSSERLSLVDIGVLARWTIKPRLLGVPGVANVAVWGQRERQLQVQVDPQHLKDEDVTLNQVVSTAGNSLWVSSLSYLEASSPGTGGFFDAPNQRLAVRHVSPLNTPAELANVPVEADGEQAAPKGPGGAPLRLGDIASVVEDHQPLIGDAIDEAVVGAEAVARRLAGQDRSAGEASVVTGVLDSLSAVRGGLAFATAVIVTPLLPVLFLDGLGSRFGRPLAFSYVVAVLAALVVALTLTPALAVALFRHAPLLRKESPVIRWLGTRYQALLERLTRTARPAFLAV